MISKAVKGVVQNARLHGAMTTVEDIWEATQECIKGAATNPSAYIELHDLLEEMRVGITYAQKVIEESTKPGA